MQQQFFGDDWISTLKNTDIPTIDLFRKENYLIVKTHLPNFTEANVDIPVDGENLDIQAQRHKKDEDKTKKSVVRTSSSNFNHLFQFPARDNANEIINEKDSSLSYKKLRSQNSCHDYA